MAPSPTGEMHIASIATVLKNYAYAKHFNGQFVLRIEDTDKTREVAGGVERIQQIIHRYGLDWDEGPGKGGPHGPYIQSQRLDIYRQKVQELVDKGRAYYCFCSKERLAEVRAKQQAAHQPPHYDQHCRHLSQDEVEQRLAAGESHVVRLKVPDDQEISFVDLLRGEISFNSKQVDDQVLLKSDGYPTYHLAVVVDDHLMQISHVIRGEEWISSTPKHVLLYRAFGWQLPVFAHLPLYLNPNGKGKMSKRHGTVSAQSFLDQGYLPEAMLNFCMILGWTPKDQREILSLAEYVQEFDVKDMSSNAMAFDLRKLNWMNGVYIRRLTDQQLAERLQAFLPSDFPQQRLLEILPLVKERLTTLAEFEQLTDFFYRDISYDPQLLLLKAHDDLALVHKQLDITVAALEQLTNFDQQTLEQVIRQLQQDHDWHKGQYFMLLRTALTGRKATPPLFATIATLGRDLTLQRLGQAQNNLTK